MIGVPVVSLRTLDAVATGRELLVSIPLQFQFQLLNNVFWKTPKELFPSSAFTVWELTSLHSSDDGDNSTLPLNVTTSNGLICTLELAFDWSI